MRSRNHKRKKINLDASSGIDLLLEEGETDPLWAKIGAVIVGEVGMILNVDVKAHGTTPRQVGDIDVLKIIGDDILGLDLEVL